MSLAHHQLNTLSFCPVIVATMKSDAPEANPDIWPAEKQVSVLPQGSVAEGTCVVPEAECLDPVWHKRLVRKIDWQ